MAELIKIIVRMNSSRKNFYFIKAGKHINNQSYLLKLSPIVKMFVQPIPITVQNGANENELVLLEFQGEFEHTELEGSNQFGGLDLG